MIRAGHLSSKSLSFPTGPQTCLPLTVCFVVNPSVDEGFRVLEKSFVILARLCEYDSGVLLCQDKFNVTLQLMSL